MVQRQQQLVPGLRSRLAPLGGAHRHLSPVAHPPQDPHSQTLRPHVLPQGLRPSPRSLHSVRGASPAPGGPTVQAPPSPRPSCQPHPRPGMAPVAQGPGADLREAQLQGQSNKALRGLGSALGSCLRPLSPSHEDPEPGDSTGHQICIFFF